MPEFYTWTILLINQSGEIGEKQHSVFGSRGGQKSLLMHVTLLGWVGTHVFIPPADFVCRGYTVFTLSVRASVRPCVRPSVRVSVRPSVTLCFLNNSKSHCWIFIKPCKHVYICKTNTLDKKVRSRGQFY